MQSLVLTAKGLHTYNNYFSEIPVPGALVEALNVIIDRDGVIEPRRGYFQYGEAFPVEDDRAKNLFHYKNRLLIHRSDDTLDYDSNGTGTFEEFNGSYQEIDPGIRIKSLEANGNFYFVEASGVKKLSVADASGFPTAEITTAGGVKALNLTANPDYTSTGFLEANSSVGYRVVWGYKDANNNLILGTPSARAVVENVSSTDSCVVQLTFPIPASVTSTNFFYQVYRTAVFSSTFPTPPPDPGDEMYLVIEEFTPTAAPGIITITDVTPDDFRASGTLLYTNPVSGEGIAQANEPPPFAKDIASYKNYTFYANTKTIQRLNLSLLSVENFTTNVSSITVSDGTTSRTYTFQGSIETYTADFSVGGAGTGSNFLAGVGLPGLYFTIDSSSNERSYYVWFRQGTNEIDPAVTGKLGIDVDILPGDTAAQVAAKTLTAIDTATSDFNISQATDTLTIKCSNNGPVTATPTTTLPVDFSISKDGLGTGEDLLTQKILLPRIPSFPDINGPTTAQQVEQAALSMVNVINADPSGLINAFYLSSNTDVPGQILFEQRLITGPAVFITANSSLTGVNFTPTLPTSGQSVISSNDISPNRIYYSKFQQPEAVPLLNYLDIGPKDKQIQRIIALRDGLFIFKEEGLYRLSGEVAPFTVAGFDNSISLIAPDSGTVLNNQIYALTTQGVVTVTDSGVSIISRPIYDQILKVTRENYAFKTATFGVGYESDASFFLFTVTNTVDTNATQCFRYNNITNSWTKWSMSKTCGIINPTDNRMYLGAGDVNFIERERKSLDASDYCDRQFDRTILNNGVINETTLILNSISEADVGDVVQQTQYMTLAQYNRILKKLDTDPSVNDTDYFSTLEYFAGEEGRNKLVNLATKLDADLGVSNNDYSSVIGSKSGAFTGAPIIGSSTVIPVSSGHGLLPGRYVSISGSATTPSIDGLHEVTAVTGTSFTIPFTTTATSAGGTYLTPVNEFTDIQGCFNIIVDKLNLDPGVFYTNYQTSEGTVEYKAIIDSINVPDNRITVHIPAPFIAGDLTLFNSIETRITWAPQFFNDPSLFKQVSEGTFMFQDKNFNDSIVSYSSDLSPSFYEIPVNGAGYGDWGEFNWGDQNWGGTAAPIPIRTLVPQQKQRCRFMYIRFYHNIAFEKYSLYGVSLKFRNYSTKAYK